jgi:hypothetical protein
LADWRHRAATHREHINVLGRYSFALAEGIAQGELRPLRHSDDGDDLTVGAA